MTLPEAIISTLTYSDYFSHPLTMSELNERLIGHRLSRVNLKHELEKLVSKEALGYTRGFYHLPGRGNLVSLRRRRALESRPLLARASVLATSLSRVSGVMAVYLTGSLAVQSANSRSDIDFMIITQPGLLWTTRLILTLLTSLQGLRRTPDSTDNYGRLCLNLYLTSASLALPLEKRGLYSAYELVQAVPLYDPAKTRAALLYANPWLSDYLPNYPLPRFTKSHSLPTKRSFLRIIEPLVYWLQFIYMRRRLTKEFITRDSAFFHPHTPRPLK